jgi:hypothetical protein
MDNETSDILGLVPARLSSAAEFSPYKKKGQDDHIAQPQVSLLVETY